MIFLFDVNALVAFGVFRHPFHVRTSGWVYSALSRDKAQFATCPITEIGFVRVLASVPDYGFTVASARQLLLDLKNDRVLNLRFLADDQDVLQLPDWVVTASQTTDGHLLQLAQAHGAALATLDQKIPGAYLIPA